MQIYEVQSCVHWTYCNVDENSENVLSPQIWQGSPTRLTTQRPAQNIVARFLYHHDLEAVTSNAIKGNPFKIKRQLPEITEQARRSLYLIMKEQRDQGNKFELVNDILFIDGVVYYDESSLLSEASSPTHTSIPLQMFNKGPSADVHQRQRRQN